jgi:pyruvate/2-oxoglutarate dehydrogenase complex dihydrolipoamide acyltransferase (E2) component
VRVDVTMPNLGYDMAEGTVAAWMKQVGDAVEPGEVIAEIETDKTTVEMESLASGKLTEIVHPSAARQSRWATSSRTWRRTSEMEGRLSQPTPMRSAIARRMTESKQRAPHFNAAGEG